MGQFYAPLRETFPRLELAWILGACLESCTILMVDFFRRLIITLDIMYYVPNTRSHFMIMTSAMVSSDSLHP